MPLRVLWRRSRIWVGVALALGLVGLFVLLLAMLWRPSDKAFPIQGLTVTEHNGPINWFEIKAKDQIRFAYVRATIGAGEQDARFAENWDGLYQAGVRRGAIHVFSLCQLAADQAGNFVANVPAHADALPMAVELDFQSDCPARPDRRVVLLEIAHFIQAVEERTGKLVVLKVTPGFEARYRVGIAFARKLWAVQSFFPPSYFDKAWAMWQANAYRRIQGVAGPVEWNVMAR